MLKRTMQWGIVAVLTQAWVVFAGEPAGITLSEPEVPYGVAATYWDVNLGSQRAVVRVAAPGSAVRVHLPWRIQMQGMQNRQIVVTGAGGQPVTNVVRVAADRMSADIVFQAASAGDYHVYYLSIRPFGHMNDWSA